jgi:hypothetical protein
MLNEMFVKLSILQDPNMKMCTLDPHVPMLKGWVGPSSFMILRGFITSISIKIIHLDN